jgi:hypothetical protein
VSASAARIAAKEYRSSLRRDSHQRSVRVNLGNVPASGDRWRAAVGGERDSVYRATLAEVVRGGPAQ